MRLLDVKRLELVDVAGDNIPEYAILSHTWGNEEVSFQEIQYVSHRWSRSVSQTVSAIKAKPGYTKIKRAAALAADHGYGFIWIDTCCIDKASSAELSEAINSMYQWYSKASVCYAYLEDVADGYHDVKGVVFSFLCCESRWFTRGWTLQELIAPEKVMFYGADWGFLGSKATEDVREALAAITGIDVRVLEGLVPPSNMSIATRMKWASQRKTTRVEDLAYSLMGIFNVNMPLLYGEGAKAFIRLQEEILKNSNDHTIFAWTLKESDRYLYGLLAENPAAFAETKDYRPLPPAISHGSVAWATTNHGLQISLFLQPVISDDGSSSEGVYDAVLECLKRRGDGWSESPAIRVRRLYGDQFARVEPQVVNVVRTPSFDQSLQYGSYELMYVKQKPVYAIPDFMISFENIHDPTALQPSIYITGVWPEKYWDTETATLRPAPTEDNRIVALFRFCYARMDTAVDCAAGLQQAPGGEWHCWTLQRCSDNGPLHKVAASANDFLAKEPVGSTTVTPWVYEDQGPHNWKLDAEGSSMISVRIQHTYMHGRLYLSVKATPTVELFSHTAADRAYNKALPLLESFLSVCSDDEPLSTRLQSLLMETTIRMSLEGGFLACEAPALLQVRTPALTPLWIQFESFINDRVIHGSSQESTKILLACKDGDIGNISCLDEGNPLLECVTADFFGIRPLHWAIIQGHIPIVELLLDLGADLCSRTTQGWQPFHLAALWGRFIILNLLADKAIQNSNSGLLSSTIEALLDDQNNVLKENPLHLAVGQVSAAVGDELDALYQFLRRTRHSMAWPSMNYFGESPFHRLAVMGEVHIQSDLRMMEVLAGAFDLRRILSPALEAEFLDKNGRSLLWHAVCAGSHEVVEHLIKIDRTSCFKADKYGITPLHLACQKGRTKVAELLLLAGANPNARTMAPGLTPSHYAAFFDKHGCLRLLLKHGADVSLPTIEEGVSIRPIHLAISGTCQKSIQILQSTGVDDDWMCTHFIRKIPSSSDVCPFELIERNMTVADLLFDAEEHSKLEKKNCLCFELVDKDEPTASPLLSPKLKYKSQLSKQTWQSEQTMTETRSLGNSDIEDPDQDGEIIT